jgi:hypothetical protein
VWVPPEVWHLGGRRGRLGHESNRAVAHRRHRLYRRGPEVGR